VLGAGTFGIGAENIMLVRQSRRGKTRDTEIRKWGDLDGIRSGVNAKSNSRTFQHFRFGSSLAGENFCRKIPINGNAKFYKG